MTSRSPARRPRVRTALAAAVLITTALLTAMPAAQADTTRTLSTTVPAFTNGFGLIQVGDPVVHSSTDFTLTVTSPQVAGLHKIRIFLPKDYATDPAKRWPTVYFLHGGAGSVDDAAAAPALHSDSVITVVPDGGLKGWYTDWVMQNTAAGAANWETFHLYQVIPFIDANLRTLPDRQYRAVVGLSMGGFGALHYAEDRPDLFGYTASLSGGIDFGMPEIRAAVLATELNLPQSLCAVATSGTGQCAGYGTYVDSDAVFGSPYPVFNADHIWNEVNPAAPANLAKLAATDITLYTGSSWPIDHMTEIATANVKSGLDALGIPSRVDDYADGSSLAPGCDGGHSYACWAPALADYMPRLQAAFDTSNRSATTS